MKTILNTALTTIALLGLTRDGWGTTGVKLAASTHGLLSCGYCSSPHKYFEKNSEKNL